MTVAQPVGVWLAAVRRGAGLTQTVAARRAGITSRAWQAIEAGRQASPRTLARVAEVLDLDAAAVRHLDRLSRPPYAAPAPPDPAQLSQMVTGLAVPAWVVDPAWNVLSASSAAPTVHNLASWAIQISSLWDDWPTIAGQAVARSRAVASWYAAPGQAVLDIVAALCAASDAAAAAWSAGRVEDTPHHEVVRLAGSAITMQWAWLGADPSARLVMITDIDGRPPVLSS
ncbi:helix-turn-helix domain-containing protein [Verrucosispora sp. NA02020]|uniref:helix-turn-helix domain-containing protein n=1 Tax=Verrucosispora sp. NA02020 TaxID=2742132 RepID=UPI001591D749|nr:helix-turn-helix transcriptional regulator [Verrucosispora sp. NA02020]QKW17577.1 helix-turn-helix domain-containing protein [Verrucosispora sp. NA02020]